jgi:hypothetical protein
MVTLVDTLLALECLDLALEAVQEKLSRRMEMDDIDGLRLDLDVIRRRRDWDLHILLTALVVTVGWEVRLAKDRAALIDEARRRMAAGATVSPSRIRSQNVWRSGGRKESIAG